MAISRRSFVGGAVAVVVAACTGDDAPTADRSTTTVRARPAGDPVAPVAAPPTDLDADPFGMGVASGDPTASSVILWCRLAVDPGEGDGGMGGDDVEVAVDVAVDDGFAELVASEVVVAPAEFAHSVHADIGALAPAATYSYRFRIGPYTSATGRTRTMPAPGVRRESFSFAFASCQDFEDGFYAAHRHLAAERVDLVVWLGDYVYEGAGRGVRAGKVRAHDGDEPRTVEGYRRRYAQYRSDPDLQAAHASAPWAVTWDDHEVANNHAGDISDGDEAPEAFRARRAAAYQAWYEHQPVRLPPPSGADYRVERTIAAGDLVNFHLLDTRQHRSDQACGTDGDIGARCAEVDAEDRTMLGDVQERWLDDAVAGSGAVWDVVANQTILSPTPFEVGPLRFLNLDQWDGYGAARRRFVQTLGRATNPVVLTGDVHASVVADLTADPDVADSEVIGTEFVGTSISSSFPTDVASVFESAAERRPGVAYANARQRGYVRCEVSADQFLAVYRLVTDATDPDSPIEAPAAFRIDAGSPGVRSL